MAKGSKGPKGSKYFRGNASHRRADAAKAELDMLERAVERFEKDVQRRTQEREP